MNDAVFTTCEGGGRPNVERAHALVTSPVDLIQMDFH